MKPLKEAFINKNTIKNISFSKFGVTKKDLIGTLEGFPLGVVVRMLEEQELQGNKPNVKVFQNNRSSDKNMGGFNWNNTEAGYDFWEEISDDGNYDKFYKKYSEYKKYDL